MNDLITRVTNYEAVLKEKAANGPRNRLIIRGSRSQSLMSRTVQMRAWQNWFLQSHMNVQLWPVKAKTTGAISGHKGLFL